MTAPLMQASRQWAIRPADQRFTSLTDLHAAVTHHREVAAEQKGVALRNLRVVTETGRRGDRASRARHDHDGQDRAVHALQLRPVGAEARCPRVVPARVARRTRDAEPEPRAREGRSRRSDRRRDTLHAAVRAERLLVLRALTSDKYTRIWNSDVTARLIKLTEDAPEWQPAPAAFDGSRGLYASEKDVFAFMVDDDRRIFETLPGGGLSRGFFISNSEVGDASFSLTTFLYQYVCGNHMVWGAQGVKNIRIPHIGNADTRAFRTSPSSCGSTRRVGGGGRGEDRVDDRGTRSRARRTTCSTRSSSRSGRHPEGRRAQAIEIADTSEDRYGNPRSIFALVSGITEIAARQGERRRAGEVGEGHAGKVAQIAFA
jgi:hypothetical protein